MKIVSHGYLCRLRVLLLFTFRKKLLAFSVKTEYCELCKPTHFLYITTSIDYSKRISFLNKTPDDYLRVF